MDSDDAGASSRRAGKIEGDVSKYETVVTDEAALDRWIAEARTQGYVAIDTETDCLDCISAKLAGISLATGPNKACYIPVGHMAATTCSAKRPEQLPLAAGAATAEAAAGGSGGPARSGTTSSTTG